MAIQQPSIETIVEERLRMLPRYTVILHNDEFHDMDHVVRALLQTIQALSVDEAIGIMLTAHTQGQADVITCLRETAEFYCAGLQRYGLESTIEPV